MSSVILNGDTSGSVSISPPAVAGTQTVTLPAASGQLMVSGNMPAFGAYLNGNQSGVTRSSWTKITFNAENFDTANAFDSSTNYRFTPQVAGYYLISVTAEDATGVATGYQYIAISKNGSNYCKTLTTSSGNGNSGTATAVLYLNGSTDYIEGYYFMSGSGSCSIDGASGNTFMSGSLIRSA